MMKWKKKIWGGGLMEGGSKAQGLECKLRTTVNGSEKSEWVIM